MTSPDKQIAYLRSPAAIRERCGQILALAEADGLAHFRLHPDKLATVAESVVSEIRTNYPNLRIPYHSRWQHFLVGGRDRVKTLPQLGKDGLQKGRALFDLVITSVLLDAGAGPTWHYLEKDSGATFVRSEGLAVASFDMFKAGAFSSNAQEPLRADAAGLRALTVEKLAKAFQVSQTNPLAGLEGRVELLQRLGSVVAEHPLFAGEVRRPGNLFDVLVGKATNGKLSALKVLDAVLEGLGNIWPGRLELAGVNLGDCWRHPQVRAQDDTDHLIPFHKLSQWLTYSLLEPLEEYGLVVTELEQLTGLPEYRNGGLLLDFGLITLKDPKAAKKTHLPGDPLIVEWRALTVALLDRIAQAVRENLGKSAAEFPLAKVLQGGTWSAGRRIAKQLRSDGSPPLTLESDGTVF